MNWLDELQHIVKHILFPVKKECGVCYNHIAEDEDVTGCYHCKSLLCAGCAMSLLNTTAYWCPYCRNHLIYPEICRPSGEYNAELDNYMRMLVRPTISNGLLPPTTYVAALHPLTIDKLCELGASRNNGFDEHFVKRMASEFRTCKIPIL